MINILIGQIGDGRLGRLPFLRAWLLLVLTGIVLSVLVAVAFGVGLETFPAAGAPMEEGDADASDRLGWLSALLLAVITLPLLFMHLNVMAKRVRDIGLPGWPTVAVLAVVGGLLPTLLSDAVAGLFNLLVVLGLVLVPGGAAAGRRSRS